MPRVTVTETAPAAETDPDRPFKTVLVPRLAPGRDRARARDRIVTRHGALVMSVPAFQDVFSRYAMNRVLTRTDGIPDPALHLLYAPDATALAVVEHVGPSRAAYLRAREDPEYLARVRPEEEYLDRELLMGRPTMYDVRTEHVFGAAEPVGGIRVFDFVRRHSGITAEGLQAAVRAEGELLAQDAEYRSVVRRREHDVVVGGLRGADHDVIVQLWLDDPASLPRLASLTRRTEAARTPYADVRGSFSLVAREHLVTARPR
ncbi:EthD domain-containing protein [Streptomyces sp. NPDC051576]|uniref:EthD domain-containing protein n=1 Tax=Streptomyces sp. NPDC051576 TaxID=3155803 RepID=UPI0034252085